MTILQREDHGLLSFYTSLPAIHCKTMNYQYDAGVSSNAFTYPNGYIPSPKPGTPRIFQLQPSRSPPKMAISTFHSPAPTVLPEPIPTMLPRSPEPYLLAATSYKKPYTVRFNVPPSPKSPSTDYGIEEDVHQRDSNWESPSRCTLEFTTRKPFCLYPHLPLLTLAQPYE